MMRTFRPAGGGPSRASALASSNAMPSLISTAGKSGNGSEPLVPKQGVQHAVNGLDRGEARDSRYGRGEERPRSAS